MCSTCAQSEALKQQERYSILGGFLWNYINHAVAIPYLYRITNDVETVWFLSESMSKIFCQHQDCFLKNEGEWNGIWLDLIYAEIFMSNFLWVFLVLTGPSNTFSDIITLTLILIFKAGLRDSLFIMAILFKTYLYRFIWVCARPKYYLYERVTTVLLPSKAQRVHPCISLVWGCRLFLMLLLNALSLISTMTISLK